MIQPNCIDKLEKLFAETSFFIQPESISDESARECGTTFDDSPSENIIPSTSQESGYTDAIIRPERSILE
jgi:hypothetical protein